MCVAGLVWAFWERKPPLWQVMHLPAIPAWFMVAGDQLMNPLAWHVSHCAAVGMCVAGLARALAKVWAPLWQEVHWPAVPTWSILDGLKAVVLAWQVSHWAPVGMWLVGLPRALLPLWQFEHRPAAGGLAVAWLKVAVAQDVVDAWQVSHWAEVATCVVGLTWAFCARKAPLWQVEQLPAAAGPLMLACMVPMPTETGTKAMPGAWQASQAALVGMCLAGLPVARMPLWQLAQLPGATSAWL